MTLQKIVDRHIILSLLGVLALTGCLAGASGATTYYVSTSGNDSNSGLSPTDGWASIDRGDVLRVLNPGDTVLVQPGTYNTLKSGPYGSTDVVIATQSGAPGSPITYKANGPGVVIDGGADSDTGALLICWLVGDGSAIHDIVIDGFEFKRAICGIASNSVARLTVRNCLFHSMRGTSVSGVVYDNVATDCAYTDNTFRDCSSAGEKEAFWVQYGSGHLIARNLMYGFGGGGVKALACIRQCTGVRVYNNTCDGASNLVRPWEGSSGTLVANNIVTNATESAIGNWDGAGAVVNSYNLFYNNKANYSGQISPGVGESTADPLFVDAANREYRLLPGSPAIDAGTNVGLPYLGLGPDIGAFESDPDAVAVDVSFVGELKSLSNGTAVSLTSAKVVTVASGVMSDGGYYIEDPDRAAGIKVVPRIGLPAVALGDRITLRGIVAVDSNGETCIDAIAVTSLVSGSELAPLGMPGRALKRGVGLDVTGLLARTYGKVSYRAPDSSFICVDDGAGIQDGTGAKGIRVLLNGTITPVLTEAMPGQFVTVTGIVDLVTDGASIVRAIRPRGNLDVLAVSSPNDETAIANWWVDMNLGRDASRIPFSFVYNGQPSSAFLATWPRAYSSTVIDANRTERTITYADPARRLRVRCVATVYSDFPAVDWTLHFDNIGSSNTPIIEDVQALNSGFACGDSTLYYSDGSTCAVTDFQPREAVMRGGSSLHFAPAGGRSSDGILPLFNLAKSPTSGVIVGVGWSGRWAATFARTGSTVNVKSGMDLTHLKLYPGETIRTPSTLLMFWCGEDRMRGQNQLRRLILAHYTPTPNGQPVMPPIAAQAGWPTASYTEANETLCINNCASHKLPIDAWWSDAGWYECDGNWLNTGSWWPDPVRFPNGMKPVGDAVHAAGCRFILWFEPERVAVGTWLADNHPEWVYGGAPSGFINYLNLGNPAALAWVKNTIGDAIEDWGVDVYRQDFNGDGPLWAWRNNDAADRQGMNEIKHIMGLYDFWDYLLARFPGLLIDNCASGGRRIDLETMKRSLALCRTDYLQHPAPQCITYGLSFWLPLTGAYGNRDLYNWWSGAGSFTDCTDDWHSDSGVWTPMRTNIVRLRSVRHLYSGDYYPLSPYSTSDDVWMAWQYDRPDLGEGLLQAFRRPASTTSSITCRLKGLIPTASYRCTDLYMGWSITRTGDQLMGTGITVVRTDRPAFAVITYKRL